MKKLFTENKYLTGDVPYHLGHSGILEFNKNKIKVFNITTSLSIY